MALRVFPPNVTQPRKSSLKKPRTNQAVEGSAELKGVAFQVNTARTSPAVVQSGDQHIKHSLFCTPTTGKSSFSRLGSLKRSQRASQRSSTVSESTTIRCDSPLDEEDDELSPLPRNATFGAPSPETRLSPGDDRPNVPLSLSTEVLPAETAVSPGGDGLSPLPERERFSAASPPKPEYPATRSLRSTSPTLVQADSPASITAPPYSPPQPSRQRSIFPRWDPTKSLNEQQYYPHGRSPTPTLAPEKVSKVVSPIDKRRTLPPLDLQHVEPMATVVVGYEHIPIANSTDLLEVWNASCGKRSVAGRKSLLRLIQPRNKGTTLGIGVSQEHVLWSMKKESIPTINKDAEPPNQLVVSKCAPGSSTSDKVAQLALPKPSNLDEQDAEDEIVGIFPHMAAIHAIETVATSEAATAIAKVDPTAKSPEAARLAQDAVAEAHRRYQSLLIRTTRTRLSLGAVTATYQLEHPTLGAFAITVTKSTAGRHSRDPRAKISLHHPSATPAAVEAETLVLAFLDFARDACVLDVPSLLALEGSYIIDTVVCALLGVAVIENDALMAETMTFAAPPRSPLPLVRSKSNEKASSEASNESERPSGLFKRNKKKKDNEELELPVLTKGALALLGMSFKVAVWTLELGVRATAGVIITTSHIVSKA